MMGFARKRGGSQDDIGADGLKVRGQVLGGKFRLKTPQARANENFFMAEGAFMQEGSVTLRDPHRGAAAPEIARHREKILQGEHFDALYAGRFGQFFEIHGIGAGDAGHEHFPFFIGQNQGFEHPGEILAGLEGHGSRREIVFVDGVFSCSVRDFRPVQLSQGVCLFHVSHILSGIGGQNRRDAPFRPLYHKTRKKRSPEKEKKAKKLPENIEKNQ
jgi:hypothetical protein